MLSTTYTQFYKNRPALYIKNMNELTQTDQPPKPIKLKPKQKLAISYWTDPESETFGNLYASCIKAQFRPSYALNITHLKPHWLSDTIDRMQLDPEHIKQGISRIATGKIDSRSVDDTRLKAYELLGRYAGMDNQGKGNVTVVNVQPILGGDSVKYSDVIDQAPEEKPKDKNN